MAEHDELDAESGMGLESELRALSATLVVAPPPEDLVERVLAQLPTPASRARTRTRNRRRRLVGAIIALVILGLGLTPPVRAAVAEWLRIGGVLFRTAPPTRSGPSPTPAAPSDTAGPVSPSVPLVEAQAKVTFPLGVPAALGPPDRISVSADRRVVGMDWGSGPDRLHLDQFDGTLSYVYLKQTRDPFEFTSVNGQDAVWFATPHEIRYVDRDGRERSEQARTSGPSLAWERPGGQPASDAATGGRSDARACPRGGRVRAVDANRSPATGVERT